MPHEEDNLDVPKIATIAVVSTVLAIFLGVISAAAFYDVKKDKEDVLNHDIRASRQALDAEQTQKMGDLKAAMDAVVEDNK